MLCISLYFWASDMWLYLVADYVDLICLYLHAIYMCVCVWVAVTFVYSFSTTLSTRVWMECTFPTAGNFLAILGRKRSKLDPCSLGTPLREHFKFDTFSANAECSQNGFAQWYQKYNANIKSKKPSTDIKFHRPSSSHKIDEAVTASWEDYQGGGSEIISPFHVKNNNFEQPPFAFFLLASY